MGGQMKPPILLSWIRLLSSKWITSSMYGLFPWILTWTSVAVAREAKTDTYFPSHHTQGCGV